MPYQVLTRKWRPQVFEEIVGQERITRTLINAISLGRINHAYLFAGPHGTGKTTTARILAKALNCEKGPTPTPCNQCSNCLEITRGESFDVIEIDGASNRGIDEIRELRERVGTTPMKGRFKVYIIDEVHMLTHYAFNALLKTLEEPPAHVVFIFATTNAQKMPSTIISRCQQFNFEKIRLFHIVTRLEQIIQEEKVNATPESLNCIARASESSMRDAEKILDQLISYTNGDIKEADVIQVSGMIESEYLAALTSNLYQREPASNIKILHELMEQGKNPQWIIKGWISWLRDLIMIPLGETDFLSFSFNYKKLLEAQSTYFTTDELIDFMSYFYEAEEKIRFSFMPQVHLEVLMIKLCSQDSETEKLQTKNPEIVALYKKIVALEKKITSLNISGDYEKITGEKTDNSGMVKEAVALSDEKVDVGSVDAGDVGNDECIPAKDKVTISAGEITEEELDELQKWNMVITEVKQKKRTLGSFLEKMKVVLVERDSIVLGSEVDFLKEILEKEENKKLICEELKKFFPGKFSLQFKQIAPKKDREERSNSLRTIISEAIDVFGGEIINR